MEITSGLASTFSAQTGRKCYTNAHKTQVEKAQSQYLQAPCAVFRYWYQLCLGCLPAWQQDGQRQWLSEQVVQVPRVSLAREVPKPLPSHADFLHIPDLNSLPLPPRAAGAFVTGYRSSGTP